MTTKAGPDRHDIVDFEDERRGLQVREWRLQKPPTFLGFLVPHLMKVRPLVGE